MAAGIYKTMALVIFFMHTPNFFHRLVLEADALLRTLFPPEPRISQRPSPAKDVVDNTLSLAEKKQVAGLMRVNHAGEVCAQALYQGQALTAALSEVKVQMQEASLEEIDHLAWCEQRLQELDSRSSYLNIFWYTGSFCIGALAGLAGDRYSLGFVAETERQVSAHLQEHLGKLPGQDHKSRIILEQMYQDEKQHAETAVDAGGLPLPDPIPVLMRFMSRIMTKISYYL